MMKVKGQNTHGAEAHGSLMQVFHEKGTRVFLQKQQTLVRQSEQASRVYFLEKGSIIIERTTSEGETVSRWVSAPAFLGLRECLLNVSHSETIIAQGPQEIWALSAAYVSHLVEEPTRAMELVRVLFSTQTVGAERVGTFDRVWEVLKRLAADFQAEASSGWALLPDFSQEKLAELAGVSRRTICRVLGQLKTRGMIRVNRKNIRINIHQAASAA